MIDDVIGALSDIMTRVGAFMDSPDVTDADRAWADRMLDALLSASTVAFTDSRRASRRRGERGQLVTFGTRGR